MTDLYPHRGGNAAVLVRDEHAEGPDGPGPEEGTMSHCHHRHHHVCGVCAAGQAAALPVRATVGVLALGAAPYVGAWRLGRALARRDGWRLTPAAQAARDARRARRSGRHAR